MPKISVIYCTARKGGLDILKKSMDQQTFRDFEIIVMDELHRHEDWYKPYATPPKKEGMFWNLSACLNSACRVSSGELIVLLQDYIEVPLDGLQKYWNRYLEEPKGLVSGVGDQYDSFTGEITFKDPRKYEYKGGYKGFYVTIPLCWEANWGSFPRQAWIDVGGFDERYDAGWGYDNTDFSERCSLNGYQVFLDTDNEVHCISHIKLFNEQSYRDSSPNNCKLYQRLSRGWYQETEPTKLNYV